MTFKFSELTGKMVDTLSEEWRFECECAKVLSMRTKGERNEYIHGTVTMGADGRPSRSKSIHSVRGEAAAQHLHDGVMLLHERRVAKAKMARVILERRAARAPQDAAP